MTYDPKQAAVLSMEVRSADEENLFRIRFGDSVKYVIVDGGVYDEGTLNFPPDLLAKIPPFPIGDWTTARIFRQHQTGLDESVIRYELLSTPLKAVSSTNIWHSSMVDINDLTEIGRISARLRVVHYGQPPTIAIAKIARFEFEISLMDRETSAYRKLQGQDVAPKFIAHLTENGRVMGFLMEKLDGRSACLDDLQRCQDLVQRIQALGILHGDLNRHNFIISDADARVVDFENCTVGEASSLRTDMNNEFAKLAESLQEDTGIGEKPLTMYPAHRVESYGANAATNTR